MGGILCKLDFMPAGRVGCGQDPEVLWVLGCGNRRSCLGCMAASGGAYSAPCLRKVLESFDKKELPQLSSALAIPLK